MLRQAIHIFRKDARYLRIEILLFIVIAGLFASGLSGALASALEVLLIIGSIHLTSRVVHAETIPGTGQFWITRPYRWQSLLLAKLMFLATWIVVPVGIARLVALAAQGYPVTSSLAPLLWSQFLGLCALLPVAALAAMTGGALEFSVGMLGLAAAYLLAFLILPAGLFRSSWPVAVEWIRLSAVSVLLLTLTGIVLLRQYKERATRNSRILSTSGVVAIMATYIAFPASTGFAIETWFPRGGSSPALTFAPDTGRKMGTFSQAQRTLDGLFRTPLAIAVGNLPQDADAGVDQISLTLDWPDGSHWRGIAGVSDSAINASHVSIGANIDMPPDVYRKITVPARMRGRIYLTMFGDARSATIPFKNRPVNALDGLQCFSGINTKVRTFNPVTGLQDSNTEFSNYYCRSFFGWPSRLVYARAGDLESGFTRLASYSPFPSGLDPDSSESRYTSVISSDRSSTPKPVTEVTIVTKKPVAHIRRDFDFPSVRLSDFLSDGSILLRLRSFQTLH
jgi:hypothetical protein